MTTGYRNYCATTGLYRYVLGMTSTLKAALKAVGENLDTIQTTEPEAFLSAT
jgi:hypothetical protein